MARVFSTSFIRSHGGAGGSYTVPDGFIAVIRNITATNNIGFGLPEGFTVYLGHSSCTIVNAFLTPLLPSSAGISYNQEFRVVVETGDVIHVTNDADVDVTVNGYLLSLP